MRPGGFTAQWHHCPLISFLSDANANWVSTCYIQFQALRNEFSASNYYCQGLVKMNALLLTSAYLGAIMNPSANGLIATERRK